MSSLEQTSNVLPAWSFAAMYSVLLLCVPTRLIFAPLGAAGTPANLLAIAGLLWWISAVIGGTMPPRRLTPMRVVLALLVASVLVSYATGHLAGWYQPADVAEATDRLWERSHVAQVTATLTRAADRGLLALAGWAGILLVTSDGIRSWKELERLLAWIVGAGSVVAAMGVVQYFTGLNVAGFIRIPGLRPLTEYGAALSRADLNRIVSTSAHPIELGVTLASLLPLALHVGIYAKSLRGWIPTVLIATATTMSVSRSAILVAGVGILVLLLGWPWKRKLITLAVIPVAALVARVALPGLLGTIRALFGALDVDPSISARTHDYDVALRLFADHALFGQGLLTFIPVVYRTLDNQLLLLLLELGVVGTTVFVALILTGQFGAWTPWLRQRDSRQRHLGLAASAAMASIFTSFVTFDALGFRQVAGLTFLFLGLSGAIWRLSRDVPDPEKRATEQHAG